LINTKRWSFLFDFDSTIIQSESLDKLAEEALGNSLDKKEILTKIELITKEGMNGTIPFDESLAARLKLFGATKSMVEVVGQSLMNDISPTFFENRSWIEKMSSQIYVVSGGFKEMMFPVCLSLGIKKNHIYGNDFIYDKDGNVMGVDSNNFLSKSRGKVNVVQSMNLEGEIAILGDGMTDYEIGVNCPNATFFAYTENASRHQVIKKASHVIKKFDDFVNYFQIS